MKTFKIITLILVTLSLSGLGLFAGDKVSANPYGYVKLDAIYDTGLGHPGNYIFWAKNPGNSDGAFHLTANQTRVGLNLEGISFGNFKVTGKIEIDFHGGNAENKAYNFMRHAFLKVSNGSFSIIAGQTSDIISPLVPSTLNYTVAWAAGNIGYRRPQLAFKQEFKKGKNVFTIHAGITRTIAGDLNGDGIEDGVAAGFPTVQGRVGAKFGIGSGSLQVGFSGHYGKSKGLVEYDSSSINFDFLLVVKKFKLIAEYFSGKNLGAYLGGIIQNINVATNEEINAKGFFVNAVAALCKKVDVSVGYGMDDPDDANLWTGNRSKNTTLFGNFVIKLSPSLKVGLEISNWVTDYLFLEQQKTLRFQHSWIFSF
jgi:hypothetical protein